MGSLDRTLRAITEANVARSALSPPRRGPVSWMVMPSLIRFSAPFVALPQCLSVEATALKPEHGLATAGNARIPRRPVAGVRYNNKFDVTLGAAYAHIKAGPPPLHEGANLGGLDLTASYWFSKRWPSEGTGALTWQAAARITELTLRTEQHFTESVEGPL